MKFPRLYKHFMYSPDVDPYIPDHMCIDKLICLKNNFLLMIHCFYHDFGHHSWYYLINFNNNALKEISYKYDDSVYNYQLILKDNNKLFLGDYRDEDENEFELKKIDYNKNDYEFSDNESESNCEEYEEDDNNDDDDEDSDESNNENDSDNENDNENDSINDNMYKKNKKKKI